ncbi:YciI family protein [Rhodococcus sp. HNM0569]|uniref:YciI family protein n=1 Tax=Rhodococcus sp. HNM0569 TaxID=2716340 RepID=UPI00146BD6FB|nr:YciI family protein [Rhodococcus sp. HNM0569]NLU81452.1 hypothetical protein [Rhodococcus sp. HNM0569]
MKHVVVRYTYAPEHAAERDVRRPEHRAWLAGLVDRGAVVTTGPFADGSGAFIVARGADAAAVEKLFDDDPFARAGLVAAREFVEWTPVMGAFSE